MSGTVSTPVAGQGTPKVGLDRRAVPAGIAALWTRCHVVARKELREK